MKFRYSGVSFDLSFYDAGDHIARVARATNSFYELDLLEYIRAVGIHGPVAIDVGANVGNHSVFFGSFVAGRVICVEPNHAVLPHLRRNTSVNPGSYEIVSKGLGSARGRGSIEVPNQRNVGSARLVQGNGEVPITTLDEIAPSSGVSLIKIDVEGMELDVLRGARATLSEQQPHLVVEAATEASLAGIRDYLSPLGYVSLSRWAATPTYHFACRPGWRLHCRSRVLKMADEVKRTIRGKT